MHDQLIHSVNVALLAALVGMRLGYKEKGLKSLILGALLHDVGKNKVPKEILNKPGKLSDEEFSIVKQHPLNGVEMLKKTRSLNCVMAMVSQASQEPCLRYVFPRFPLFPDERRGFLFLGIEIPCSRNGCRGFFAF